MNLKISVVVPTYRRPALLDRCLEALLGQNFDDYEIIVVTDGPDPVSKRVVESKSAGTSERLQCLSLPVKRGPAAARNLGWAFALGKLIAFTDDDCIPDPDWLKAYWTSFSGEDLMAFSGSVKVPVNTPPTDFEKNTKGLEAAEFITANCACTKKALEATAGFDEAFTMAWREDSDMQFKLLIKNIAIVKVEAARVIHPVRKAPWGISLKEQKKGIFNALLFKKYPGLYRHKIQKSPAWNYVWIITSFSVMIVALMLKLPTVVGLFAFIWLSLTMKFIARRLEGTSHSFENIAEMVVTSFCIPFLSIYWQLYGAIKYRVLFL